jgi:hypothetical protein
MLARQILVIKNMMKDIIITKNHHNYLNKLVYEDFIKFLMMFFMFSS